MNFKYVLDARWQSVSGATFPPSSHIPGTTAGRQGASWGTTNPGLKPWAKSCCPFGASHPTPPRLIPNAESISLAIKPVQPVW